MLVKVGVPGAPIKPAALSPGVPIPIVPLPAVNHLPVETPFRATLLFPYC